MGRAMGFELFERQSAIGVFIDLLEHVFRALRILLCPWTGLEFIKAHGTTGIRVQFLEHLFQIRAGTLRAAWTLGAFRTLLSE